MRADTRSRDAVLLDGPCRFKEYICLVHGSVKDNSGKDPSGWEGTRLDMILTPAKHLRGNRVAGLAA